jgi:hypothetical protein
MTTIPPASSTVPLRDAVVCDEIAVAAYHGDALERAVLDPVLEDAVVVRADVDDHAATTRHAPRIVDPEGMSTCRAAVSGSVPSAISAV